MGEKVGKKLGEKMGEKTGEKVGESLGEIHKLNLCQTYRVADSSCHPNFPYVPESRKKQSHELATLLNE